MRPTAPEEPTPHHTSRDTPYFALSECGFYLRATAPEEPPRQDRSSYTPEF